MQERSERIRFEAGTGQGDGDRERVVAASIDYAYDPWLVCLSLVAAIFVNQRMPK